MVYKLHEANTHMSGTVEALLSMLHTSASGAETDYLPIKNGETLEKIRSVGMYEHSTVIVPFSKSSWVNNKLLSDWFCTLNDCVG